MRSNARIFGVACNRAGGVSMRGRIVAVTVCIVLAAAAVAGVLLLGHSRHPTSAAHEASHRRRPAPAGALSAVKLLVSDQGRKALAPALAAVIPPGRPFPAGTTFSALPGSWQRTGVYANITGMLREPGHAPVRAEIGLVKRGGRWLVTFEANR